MEIHLSIGVTWVTDSLSHFGGVNFLGALYVSHWQQREHAILFNFFFGSAKTIPATMVYWQKTFSNLAARSLPKLQYRTVINFWRCLFVWMVFWLHFVDTNFGKFWKKKRAFIFQIISKNAFGQISQVANKKKEEGKNTCRNFCLLSIFTWKAQ